MRTSLDDAAAALATSSFGMLPVVGDDGRYAGCVSAQDVAEALARPHTPTGLEVKPTRRAARRVAADTSADELLARLSGRGGTGLPVLDPDRPSSSDGSPTNRCWPSSAPTRRRARGRAMNMDNTAPTRCCAG